MRYRRLDESTPSFDDDGNPIAAAADWSACIPCLINTMSDKMNAQYVDGEYRAMSFEVLIESVEDFCADSVMLTRHCECLGEFRIIRKELLPNVGRTRIFV